MEDDNRVYLGQHFLVDYNVISRIIESCNVEKKDVVLEFGTGYGHLTKKISERVRMVYTYEIDKQLYSKSNQDLAHTNNVVIYNQDFFKQDERDFDFFLSNIPYSRSKEIMKWLVLHEFREGVIMVQKDFSDKLIAFPGKSDYTAVSVISQFCFDIEPLFNVKKNSFDPPPKVDSKVVRLIRKRSSINKQIISGLEYLFSIRNKNATHYHNKKFSQLDVEDLIDISRNMIKNNGSRI